MRKFPIDNLVDEDGNPWHTNERRLKRLNYAVKGAHLVVSFQCETCWMRLLEGRNPDSGDKEYLSCLRRANLDAIAGRSKVTISSHTNRFAEVIRNCVMLRRTPSYPPRGPFPDYDCVGMGTAVDMLYKSLHAKGRNKSYVQFDTLRQIRSSATVCYQSSALGMIEGSSFSRGTATVRPTNCNTQSIWFGDFLRGAEYRMGHEGRANKPISMRATIEILSRLKLKAEEEANATLSHYYYRVGAMIAVLTGGSLRGTEGFFVCLVGLRKYLQVGKQGTIPSNYSFHYVFSEEEARLLPLYSLCSETLKRRMDPTITC